MVGFSIIETLPPLWTPSLYTDENHIWVVGANGLILFGDGHDWRYQSCDTMECLNDVVATDSEHAWAVSSDGGIYARTPPDR
jgi:hypothetical protein